MTPVSHSPMPRLSWSYNCSWTCLAIGFAQIVVIDILMGLRSSKSILRLHLEHIRQAIPRPTMTMRRMTTGSSSHDNPFDDGHDGGNEAHFFIGTPIHRSPQQDGSFSADRAAGGPSEDLPDELHQGLRLNPIPAMPMCSSQLAMPMSRIDSSLPIMNVGRKWADAFSGEETQLQEATLAPVSPCDTERSATEENVFAVPTVEAYSQGDEWRLLRTPSPVFFNDRVHLSVTAPLFEDMPENNTITSIEHGMATCVASI